MMGRQTRRPDGQPTFFPKEILMFTKWSVSGMWIVTYLSRLELRSHAAVGESPTPPEETQERQMSGRPIYTPESGDTQFDLLVHCRADIAWLELVIISAREALIYGDVSGAETVLRHSGVRGN